MRNLVYAKSETEFAKVLKATWEPQAKKFFDSLEIETMQSPFVKPGTLVAVQTPFQPDDAIGRAMMTNDHAKDIGIVRGGDIQIWDDPIMKPLEVGTLDVYWNRRTQIWHFRDDRGVEIQITEAAMGSMELAGVKIYDSLRRGWMRIVPSTGDKLHRFFHIEDDRGCSYPINVMHPVPRICSYVPLRGVLTGTLRIEDPNKHKGEPPMATAKKTTDNETPIEQTQPKLGVFFKVNDLPQELTQKQTVEHVTKLLTLGAAQVSVQRYIRDETSSRLTPRNNLY